MGRAAFTHLQKALAEHDRKALLGLIRELYDLSGQNRDFLNTRFAKKDATLLRYKKIILQTLDPKDWSWQSGTISFREARKAIADYKKALGELKDLAELTIYAVECAYQFASKNGDLENSFYHSFFSMFQSAVTLVRALEPKEAESMVARLAAVSQDPDGTGWGFYDDLGDILSEAFPEKNRH